MKLQKNRELRNNLCTTEELILYYMDLLEKRYQIKLVYGDLSNLMYTHPRIQILRNYQCHNNDYCDYFKQNSIFRSCIYEKEHTKKILKKTKKPFYGTCYAGIEEYFFPVLLNDEIIGVLSSGIFCSDKKSSLEKVIKAAKMNDKNTETCIELFLKLIKDRNFNKKEFIADHQILCRLISSLYDSVLQTHGNSLPIENDKEAYRYAFGNDILASAIHFIRENYLENITLNQVAQFCYCHPHYLSNLFSKKMNTSFAKYITNSRMEHAKELLSYTTLSVREIGARTGFKDPTYFGKVFKKTMGITPNQYRKNRT